MFVSCGQQFNNAVASKSPEAVKLTKVKGHATYEMVEEGTVPIEQKQGNDETDVAGRWGSTDEQPRLMSFAKVA